MKLCTGDYATDIMHHAVFGSNRLGRGFPANNTFVTFLLYCRFLLEHTPTSNRCTNSYAEWLIRRVSAKDGPFGVRTISDITWGKYAPKLSKKGRE